jgi:hypothetical protein
MDEAQAAADALNIRENNAALDALCLTALRARDNEDLLTWRRRTYEHLKES